MRVLALFLALALAACGRGSSHMTDISGGMPRLSFALSEDGRPVTGETFRGKAVALYFGYSHCPDVCPTTLANLAQMLAKVARPDVAVLFVTVDPARDTLPVLKQYAQAFSPQVDGLRGTDNELAAFARAYRVAYTVTPGPPYQVMHSNAVFFFDKDGRARFVTTSTEDIDGMAADVKGFLN